MGKKTVVINAAFIMAKRKELKLNQADFWRELGVTQSGGSRYESGRTIPSPTRKLIHLMHVIGLDYYKLEAIAKAKFKTDFDFWLAMSDVLASFKDRHWSYLGPTCFEETLFAMIPLEFGSMVTTIRDDEQQQIIYLRAPIPFFASEYVAATGIDVTPYTGQRVVLINGEPALQFLRRASLLESVRKARTID